MPKNLLKYILCLLVLIKLSAYTTRGAATAPEGPETKDAPKPIATEAEELAELHASLPADLGEELPTILVTILVRNKAHVLPLFLTYFQKLNYPKHRIALWIRSDHNSDNSNEILQLWLNHTSSMYHSVDFSFDNETNHQQHSRETSAYDWPLSRFRHIIRLKEEAMLYARKIWADYIFYLDADVLLTHADALNYLTSLRLPVVAPMLLSEGLYSNFWCGMSSEYYYERTDEYKEIYDVQKEGTFRVPMVHSAVLVHLNYMGARYLTFDREQLREQQENNAEWAKHEGLQCRYYNGPVDDIIVFAISANCSQIPLHVSNRLPFGYILTPLDASDSLEQDQKQLVNIRANIIHDLGEITNVNPYFEKFISFPQRTKLSIDNIYMINLERRPERRKKMEKLFKELGLKVEYFPAVDGKKLNAEIIKEMGIKMLSGYEDPYHHRQMTMGEIGCFLSHYRIWEKMVERGENEVLILEDDIRFEPYFKQRAQSVIEQARSVVEYDLIYLGRKRLKENSEPWVAGTENLVHVGYSYWTLGYVISLQGARKLLAAEPLKKLIPVDEFLPVMFNKHPNKTWLDAFPTRNLYAYSAAPLLLFPTHYTGDSGYISDTEDSEITSMPTDQHDGAAPQLKSDREVEFNSRDLNDKLEPLGNINMIPAKNTHEEF